jgi:alpha-ribazole phosphatase
MRLYLIRHPQPDVPPGICYGSTDMAVMRDEHERALAAMSSALPNDIPIYSSPARRCAEFAALLSAALGRTQVRLDARLTEMHFGTWEMRPWNDIPRAEIDAWAADLGGYRPGGGESAIVMAERVLAFYRELQTLQKDAALVCHAGTIRVLLAVPLQLSPAETALHAARTRHTIPYGSMLVLDC